MIKMDSEKKRTDCELWLDSTINLIHDEIMGEMRFKEPSSAEEELSNKVNFINLTLLIDILEHERDNLIELCATRYIQFKKPELRRDWRKRGF